MNHYRIRVKLWHENSYTDGGAPDEEYITWERARSPETAEALAAARADANDGPFYETSAKATGETE